MRIDLTEARVQVNLFSVFIIILPLMFVKLISEISKFFNISSDDFNYFYFKRSVSKA